MACFPHSRQYGRCLSLTSFWSSGARRLLSFIGNLFKILEEFLGTSQPWIIHFFRPNSSVLGELFSIKFFECFISQRDTASHISLLTFPSCMQGAACVFRILKYLTLIVSFFFCARRQDLVECFWLIVFLFQSSLMEKKGDTAASPSGKIIVVYFT